MLRRVSRLYQYKAERIKNAQCQSTVPPVILVLEPQDLETSTLQLSHCIPYYNCYEYKTFNCLLYMFERKSHFVYSHSRLLDRHRPPFAYSYSHLMNHRPKSRHTMYRKTESYYIQVCFKLYMPFHSLYSNCNLQSVTITIGPNKSIFKRKIAIIILPISLNMCCVCQNEPSQ